MRKQQLSVLTQRFYDYGSDTERWQCSNSRHSSWISYLHLKWHNYFKKLQGREKSVILLFLLPFLSWGNIMFQYACGAQHTVLVIIPHNKVEAIRKCGWQDVNFQIHAQNLLLCLTDKNHMELTFVEKEKRRTLSLFFWKWFKSCWRTCKWTTGEKETFIYRSSHIHLLPFSTAEEATLYLIICKAKQSHNKIHC